MRLLVTGASGLIGKNLIRQALREGHEVRALVRSPEKFKMLPSENVFRWSHDTLPPLEALEGVDVIFHLAGEGIADQRWTEERKKSLSDSRILGTRNLVEALAQLPDQRRPKALVSGSAIGFYGYSPEGEVDENSPAGTDFLAELCLNWEKEAARAKNLGVRVVHARTGIVFSREGGALPKMPSLPIASGKAWMSWIHIQDMIRALLFAAQHQDFEGVMNCTTPNWVSNRELSRSLARIRGVPHLGFVPKLALLMVLGEATEALLASLRVYPRRLLEAGFHFEYPDLEMALKAELEGMHAFDRVLFSDQFVALSPDEVFPFFSRAENLESLTPPWLNFRILSKSTPQVQKGTLIEYQLKIHGAPVRWKTLISQWDEGRLFVDEQLSGPYAKWHHVHFFEKVPGGCLLRDEVTYRIPGSAFGDLTLNAWISGDVRKIFGYRQEQIERFAKSGELVTRSPGVS